MQRVEMLRVGGKDGAVERVRLDEAPLLVQWQRLLDASGCIRARGGRLGHVFKSGWLQVSGTSTSIRQGRPRWLTERELRLLGYPVLTAARHEWLGPRLVRQFL